MCEQLFTANFFTAVVVCLLLIGWFIQQTVGMILKSRENMITFTCDPDA
jgi:putative Mn2+ efflux pump MntP